LDGRKSIAGLEKNTSDFQKVLKLMCFGRRAGLTCDVRTTTQQQQQQNVLWPIFPDNMGGPLPE